MKKGWIYFLGVITGVLVSFAICIVIAVKTQPSLLNGITMFPEPAEVIQAESFKVIQVLNNGSAIARKTDSIFDHLTVLLWPDASTHFYDDQVVKLTKAQQFQRIGTYKHNTSYGEKTVPIVSIYAK